MASYSKRRKSMIFFVPKAKSLCRSRFRHPKDPKTSPGVDGATNILIAIMLLDVKNNKMVTNTGLPTIDCWKDVCVVVGVVVVHGNQDSGLKINKLRWRNTIQQIVTTCFRCYELLNIPYRWLHDLDEANGAPERKDESEPTLPPLCGKGKVGMGDAQKHVCGSSGRCIRTS